MRLPQFALSGEDTAAHPMRFSYETRRPEHEPACTCKMVNDEVVTPPPSDNYAFDERFDHSNDKPREIPAARAGRSGDGHAHFRDGFQAPRKSSFSLWRSSLPLSSAGQSGVGVLWLTYVKRFLSPLKVARGKGIWYIGGVPGSRSQRSLSTILHLTYSLAFCDAGSAACGFSFKARCLRRSPSQTLNQLRNCRIGIPSSYLFKQRALV